MHYGRTDGRTDKASYRDAGTHLKRRKKSKVAENARASYLTLAQALPQFQVVFGFVVGNVIIEDGIARLVDADAKTLLLRLLAASRTRNRMRLWRNTNFISKGRMEWVIYVAWTIFTGLTIFRFWSFFYFFGMEMSQIS